MFHKESAMDLLWPEQTPALPIVCTHTHLGSAMKKPFKSAKHISLRFLHCWSTAYVVHPNKIRTDRESGVSSALFQDLTKSNIIDLQLSPVEAHNVFGTSERYHASLRRIYSVLRRSHHNLTPRLTLCLAINTMNDTLGHERLVPSFHSSVPYYLYQY